MQNQELTKKIAGVILSGGLSTRMGQDKAMLHPYGDSAPHMLKRTHNLLSKFFDKVWVSCARDKCRIGYDCLEDMYNEIGPISGIYAGLLAAKKAQYEAILVLPCDLPCIDETVIELLLKARHKSLQANQEHNAPPKYMTTFSHTQKGYIEALVSIYEVSTVNFFANAINEGIRAPRLVIDEKHRTTVPYSSHMGKSLMNLNTVEEYADFKKSLLKN